MPDGNVQQNAAAGKRLETVADVKVLYDDDSPACRLVLESRMQGMELSISITPHGKGNIISTNDVIALFEKLNLDGSLDKAALESACATACNGEKVKEVPILHGEPPQKGKDEWVELMVLSTSQKPRYHKDEYGNINYHNLYLFENVQKDQLIALSRPAEPGSPGRSITGARIESPRGLPLDNPPAAGSNVRLEKESGTLRYYAQMPGRVSFEMNTISVSDQYVVSGDVGNATGDIDFVGDVVIGGNVSDDFNVRAGKSLTIKGAIGGKCAIESAGDMVIGGGMSSNGSGTIRCGGDLTARYLDGVNVECRKNIFVKNEIVNSIIKCGGTIRVDIGSIVGGQYLSLRGIEAKGIGSDAGVKTVLTVGICYVTEAKIEELEAQLDPIAREIEFISKKLEPVIKNPKAMLSLSPADKDRIKEMAMRFRELTPIQADLQQKLEKLRKEMEERANPLIIARSEILKGAELIIGGVREKLPHDIKRPVTVLKHSKKNLLRFTSKHSIEENAFVIEAKLLQEELEEEKRKAIQEKKKQYEAGHN